MNPKAGVPPHSRLYDASWERWASRKLCRINTGSDLIDDLAMTRAGAAGGIEVAMGFGGGQALVPQVDGEGEGCVEGFSEGVGFRCLGADVADM